MPIENAKSVNFAGGGEFRDSENSSLKETFLCLANSSAHKFLLVSGIRFLPSFKTKKVKFDRVSFVYYLRFHIFSQNLN